MKKIIIIIALVFLVALPYLPTINYDFLFDDYHLVVKNNRLASFNDLKHYFTEAHTWQKGRASYFRPMMYLSLMLNFAVSKKNVWSYHLFNILINLLVAFLVFSIAKNIYKFFGLAKAVSCAALAAALFALHPLHTEVVTNIAGRADSMMTFWILLGIVLSEKAYRGSFFAGILVGFCALAAGLTKETGFLFMPILLFYYFSFHKKSNCKKVIPWMAGALGSALAVSMYFFVMKSVEKINAVSYLDNFSPFIPFDQRIKTAIYLFGKSIKLLFVPFPLSADYSFAQITPQLSFLTLYSALAIIIILGGLLYSWKEPGSATKSITQFSISWFLLCYIFSSNLFFSIGTIFGERLLYLASVGFCVAATCWIYQIKKYKIRFLVIAIIFAFYIFIIFIRNYDWKNSKNFYRAMRMTAPKSAKAHFVSAKLAINNHNFNLAAKHLNNSLAIFPGFAEAHGLFSQVLLYEKNYSNAFVEATRAIRLNPNVASAHDALYKIYKKRGEKSKAAKHRDIANKLIK